MSRRQFLGLLAVAALVLHAAHAADVFSGCLFPGRVIPLAEAELCRPARWAG